MWIVLIAVILAALGSALLWLRQLWSALPHSNDDFEWLDA
jgi:hypothetical protein